MTKGRKTLDSAQLLIHLIELRNFGNLLLEITSAVDSVEIEDKIKGKTLEEKENLVANIFRETLNSIIDKTFEKIKEILNPQVMSVFLFNKDDLLQKYKTHGKNIENDWLQDEKYRRGESFSGISAQGTPYGKPHFSNSLDKNIDKLTYGEAYAKKLGFLRCGISVPLDSSHRTFGTIEVINKLEHISQRPDKNLFYSDEDIFLLTIIGGHLARAISRIRDKQKERMIAEITHKITQILIQSDTQKHTSHEPPEIYQTIINQLVCQLTPYKACILRFLEGDTLPIFETASTDDIDMAPKKFQIRRIGEGMVGKVAQTGQYIVKYVDENPEEFKSRRWIISQKLKSFICFPLSIEGKVVGTLSLFTGYKHDFKGIDFDFLTNFSRLLAAYKVAISNNKNIEKHEPNDSKQYIENQTALFEKHLPHLREKYLNKYVWFHNGEVLESDDNEITLLKRVYHKYPEKESKPLFIEQVTEKDIEPEIWDYVPL